MLSPTCSRVPRRGELHEFQAVLDAALAQAQPYARELQCEQAVARIPSLEAAGGGCGRQRAVYELSGFDSLLRDLIATTARTTGITEP